MSYKTEIHKDIYRITVPGKHASRVSVRHTPNQSLAYRSRVREEIARKMKLIEVDGSCKLIIIDDEEIKK